MYNFRIVVRSLRSGCRYTIPLSAVTTSSALRKYSQSNNEVIDNKIATIPTPQDDNQYEEDIKSKIMENALSFVHKSGWSIDSISAGAEAAGYPGITHGLFPNGGGDLVHYFNVKCNNELVEHMKSWPKELNRTKVPAEFLENAIMTRLLMIEPYKSTWPSAIALQALPSNVPNCLATLLSLVDDICYYSGDRSVDFNWYVRRVGLAGIYKTAELFYLADNSQESNATKNFIASRIKDAQLIQAALNMNPIATAPNTMTAAFVTAKNILGINTLK